MSDVIYIGVRISFDTGTILEMTHDPKICTEYTAEVWAARLISFKEKAKRERFESPVPLDRTVWLNGRVEDRLNPANNRLPGEPR